MYETLNGHNISHGSKILQDFSESSKHFLKETFNCFVLKQAVEGIPLFDLTLIRKCNKSRDNECFKSGSRLHRHYSIL